MWLLYVLNFDLIRILCISLSSQNKPTTPFVLILSTDDAISANLVARGPCPLNCMQLVPDAVDLTEFGEQLCAKVKSADALMPPAWDGGLHMAMLGEMIDVFFLWSILLFGLFGQIYMRCFRFVTFHLFHLLFWLIWVASLSLSLPLFLANQIVVFWDIEI